MTNLITRIQSVGSAVGLTYGSTVIGSIIVTIAAALLGAFGIDVTARPSLRLVMTTILLQGVTFGGLSILYLRFRGLNYTFVSLSIPDRRDIAVTIGGIGTLLSLLVVSSRITSALGLESAENQVVTIGQQNPTAFLVLIPLSFLLVGPGEELLYRGLVQGTLRETLHPTRAIVLASILFASIHLFSLSGEGKLVYVGIAFILALVLGATYEYTDNLTVPAVIHGAYNAIQFTIAYLTATGGV
ncbi:CPBP family intramembrane metalloprotease [Halorubrum sp. Atlit-8R]|jgi:membrane protease YdiL (CAAX protease family)|uniref:CPBP family intramembrane metalloprotease n=2 Tax=Haloferacaceae TaxID=1644056 RepID=A0A7D3Y2Z1_9EURY|nr:CPBP family intramembrane metalloprotease [Halorubrum salinarum]RLM76720.1 CPBP family intramembrane metalloprotease [Halorubrum sp. Atlit-8R]TKX85150.1 CPBP family intramembrane metalloprotease [Halorubrum sp. SS5]